MNDSVYNTEDLWRKDRDHYIHPWTDFSVFKEKGSLVISESEGAYVFDSDGKKYLDGIGGLWCVNIGYGNEEMVEAIADQVRKMPYYSTFTHVTTPPAAELAAKLAEYGVQDSSTSSSNSLHSRGGSEAHAREEGP